MDDGRTPELRRMMVEYGEHFWKSGWAPLYGVLGGNPLAAMPSLHFATSVTAAHVLTETGAVAAFAGLDLHAAARPRARLPRRALRRRPRGRPRARRGCARRRAGRVAARAAALAGDPGARGEGGRMRDTAAGQRLSVDESSSAPVQTPNGEPEDDDEANRHGSSSPRAASSCSAASSSPRSPPCTTCCRSSPASRTRGTGSRTAARTGCSSRCCSRSGCSAVT